MSDIAADGPRESGNDTVLPKTRGASHVAFTVNDMSESADWYQRVFGWVVIGRFGAGEAGTPRIILFDQESGFALSLCMPEDGSKDPFDHRRTGLDHFAWLVDDGHELQRWMTHLDELGVDHSPVRELPFGRFVSFEDPDGIQLELWVNTPSDAP